MSQAIKDLLNDEDQLNEVVRMAFDAVDTDKSGQIDSQELENALTKMMSEIGASPPTKEEVQEILNALDTDKSGKISFDELKVLVRNLLKSMTVDA